MPQPDPRVDAYIAALPGVAAGDLPARCARWSTRPTRRSRRRSSGPSSPTSSSQGNVIALLAAKDHVSVFLYDGGLTPDPEGIITAGHGNKTGRQISIRDAATINEPAMVALFRAIISNNRAGGWRQLKRDRGE